MLGAKEIIHFQKYRHPRYNTDGFEDTFVELSLPQAEAVIQAHAINFSKNGLAFQIRNPSLLPITPLPRITQLKFKAFGRVFFDGEVEVKHSEQVGENIKIGVFTQDKTIKVEDVLGAQISYQILQGVNGFGLLWSHTNTISEEFKLAVIQYRDYLLGIKGALEKTEEEIASFPVEEQGRIGQSILICLEMSFKERSDLFFEKTNHICGEFDEKRLQIYKAYFQSHLHDLILLCPFGKRCVDKPLGYSGDYEVMNMIYGDHYQGSSLFSKLENRYWCTIGAARANIDRLNYFKNKLEEVVGKGFKENRKVKITSLGSGPAKEIYDFIETNPLSDYCIFTCVDLEPKALEYSQQHLCDIAKKKNRNVQLNFVSANVVSYLRSTPHAFMYEQDLLYASGLYDYLKLSVGQKLTEAVSALVKEGGEMIFVNASVSNPCKIGMEFAGDWYLYHRTKEEMLELTANLNGYQKKELFLDRENVYWFLSLKK